MNCRICDSDKLELALDLGLHPWCNHFLHLNELGTEPKYPLRLVHCSSCKGAQLDYTVKKETMFSNHTYLSGITHSLSQHFKNIAIEVNERFPSSNQIKSVLDIGSNDGTQLKHFQALGYDVLGVESSTHTAEMANAAGIPTCNAFFNESIAIDIGRKFDVINAAGVFFHLEELHSVTDGIKRSLKNDGIFVVQFLYMKSIVENLAFDQIYHEHLLYYNLQTIEHLLQLHELELFDAYLAPIHGGSIIGFIAHKGKRQPTKRLGRLKQQEHECQSNQLSTYLTFAQKINKMKKENLQYLSNAKKQGKQIFGMGAPVKGNTLLNYFGIGPEYIDCLVEKNKLRRGLYSPGMHIPVLLEEEILQTPDIYYVLAWNFKEEILAKNHDLIKQGVEFYFPVNPRQISMSI